MKISDGDLKKYLHPESPCSRWHGHGSQSARKREKGDRFITKLSQLMVL